LDLRAGLDDLEDRKFLALPGLELRPLCRPARSQSLYRLSYPGPQGRRVNQANNKQILRTLSRGTSDDTITPGVQVSSGKFVLF
jgi:hypothetical protein